MGRTIHYQTREPVTLEEFRRIKKIEDGYNSKHQWSHECIKLWKKSYIWNEPTFRLDGTVKKRDDPDDAIWGFTKVNDKDEEGKLIIQAVREMSRATPRLTWIVSDEGDLLRGRKIKLRAGAED